jgi:3-deoxy-D-manno-octulosonate 8-phosphate phosphatase (KDO 8-P phosphatase)
MRESQAIPRDLARSIRLVVLDVDGVLTDGGIYLAATESGERLEAKRFEITDGLGVGLLRKAGIEVAIVTGRRSEVVAMRARELAIEEVHQDPEANKLPIVEDLLRRKGLAWDAVACVADDLADLPVLRRSALPVAVANAVPEVRGVARWFTSRRGGEGAVREFAETLLKARGDWVDLVGEYLREREAS